MEKRLNPEFRKIVRTWGWSESCPFWNSSVWQELFAGGSQKKLPANDVTLYGTVHSGDGSMSVEMRLLPLGAKTKQGNHKHRAQARCLVCRQWVPAGRIGQHKC